MIKVEHTKQIKLSEYTNNLIGICLATEAKLVLVKDDRRTCEGLIRCIKEWKSFVDPETDFANVGDVTIGKNWSKGVFEYWEPIKPILISENNEKIEVGDWAYDAREGKIIKSMFNLEPYEDFEVMKYLHKILALPEHFSPQQLSQIVSGELKDSQKVLLEVEKV